MSWTDRVCRYELKNGKINIKAELDSIYTYRTYDFEKGTCVSCEVLKSAIRGNEYYAAIKFNKYKFSMGFCGGKVEIFHVLTRIPAIIYIGTIF